MVVEIHDAAMIRTLTSPVAANQLAAGAFFPAENGHPGFDKPFCCYPARRRRFFSVKMTIQDLTSPLAAIQLVAVFFSLKITIQHLTSPVAAIQLAAGAFFSVKMTTHGFDKPDGRGRRNLEPAVPPGDKVPPRMDFLARRHLML